MIDIEQFPGAMVVDEADLPPAVRDLLAMLAATSGGIATLDSDDLPAGFADVLGSGAGLTIVLADGLDADACEMPRIDALIADVELIGRDIEALLDAGDELSAAGARTLLRTGLFKLASAAAGRNGEVRAKAKCVRAHIPAAGLAPIGEAMLGAALAVDAADWGIC